MFEIVKNLVETKLLVWVFFQHAVPVRSSRPRIQTIFSDTVSLKGLSHEMDLAFEDMHGRA
jgi:hypothetical protein